MFKIKIILMEYENFPVDPNAFLEKVPDPVMRLTL